MGDTLTGLGISEQDLYAFVDWYDGDNSEPSTEEEELDAQFNHFWTAGLECSSTQQPLQLPMHRTIAVDISELQQIMLTKKVQSGHLDVVELCGGRCLTSYLCQRLRLSSGHNFDILTGFNLNLQEHQQQLWRYLETTKPTVVVMAPVCTPFAAWSHLNRQRAPAAWKESYDQAYPHARLCGRVAQHQLDQGLYFVCEQPAVSSLWQEPPWPTVCMRDEIVAVRFPQCALGQHVNQVPSLKMTVFVTNVPEVIKEFSQVKCPGCPQHADLAGG
eukprot:2426544-Amphidinium_carterae.5